MNRRVLVVAALFALIAIASLVLYRRRYVEEASGGAPVRVLALSKPLQAGDVIDEDSVAIRVVPHAYVEDRAVSEADRSKVLGMRVARSVHPPEVLFWTDLPVSQDEHRNLSEFVQQGMRAVTVRVGGRRPPTVRRGDHIDIIATVPRLRAVPSALAQALAGAGPGASRIAKLAGLGSPTSAALVLQNVIVLGTSIQKKVDIDATTPEENRTQDIVKKAEEKRLGILSLSLTIPEAQLLSLAAEQGSVTVALRNPDDSRIVEGQRDVPDVALYDVTMRGAVQSVRRMGMLAKLDSIDAVLAGAAAASGPAGPGSPPPKGGAKQPAPPRRGARPTPDDPFRR